MCGIVGFSGHMDSVEEARFVLNKMLTRIRHRGPDEAGNFVSPGVGLGSVRLSIIDLSTGQQPLCDDTGRFWITFNGEIFNYQELRVDLEKRGCRFKTHSDTEVLLLAYREYGSDCLNLLNGQFAFAVWDMQKESLFMARDRVGIRPLFYSLQNSQLVFGSEIKAIFEFPGIKRELDPVSLQQVFTFWTTLTPRTSFSGVNELPPGHFLYFEKGNASLKKYWDQTFPDEGNGFKGSFNEAGEQLEYLLTDAVKLRLRADVPVGSYLSGGLDSSVIASLIRKNSPEGLLQTFSIGFSDKEFDEGNFQTRMVELLQTRHHQTLCKQEDIEKHFPKTVWHAEMPLLRTAPLPMLLLSGLVRENNIKVVMTGEGADEMLGGYNIFKEMLVRRFWSKEPSSKLRPLLLSKLYPYLSQLKTMSPSALKMFFGYRLQDIDSVLYSHLLRWSNTSKIRKLMAPQLVNGQSFVDSLEKELEPVLRNKSDLAKAQYLETKIFMSGYLLSSQGDRMAMGNSVEGRYPFLDHRVMEFCNTLPDDYKLSGLKEKVLLKNQFKDRLPSQVVERSKQAYRAPLAAPFLNKKNQSEYVEHLLSEDFVRSAGLFDPRSVSVLMTKLMKGTSYSEVDQMGLVAILSTHLLWQQFISDFTPLTESGILISESRNTIKKNT
ncbi:asparagine synthase (glutamine-hydrolyzing) [Marinilabilia sp.]